MPLTAPSTFAAQTPRLQLAGISKIYPGVVANSDIALSVLPG